jgi:hypothetical protein
VLNWPGLVSSLNDPWLGRIAGDAEVAVLLSGAEAVLVGRLECGRRWKQEVRGAPFTRAGFTRMIDICRNIFQ